MTIYVSKYGNDLNIGTELYPFLTIQKAIDMSQSPDAIIIDDGIYNERIKLFDKHDISIKSKNPRLSIIYGSGIGSELSQGERQWGNGLVDIKNSSTINITDLKIQNSLLCGVVIENSEFINIKNNTTYNTYSSAIQAHFSNNIIVDNNECELGANAPNDLVQEIISFHAVDGYEILNNYVHDGGPSILGGEGICVKAGSSNGKIHYNTIKNLTTYTNKLGIYMDAWDVHQENVQVHNNLCKNTGWGIGLSGEIGGTLNSIDVHNNILVDSIVGILIPAYNIDGGDAHLNNIDIHNNTINNVSYVGISIGSYPKTLINNLTIRDNLFASSNGDSIIWTNRDRHTNVVVDHNYYDDLVPQNQDSYYGTNYVVGGDPLFIDPTNDNFRLQTNSPAVGYGAYPYPMLCSFTYSQ